MMTYEVLEDSIPVEIYRNLRRESGLTEKSTEAAEIGLPNSLFSVMIGLNGEVIGMGRVIGDGGCFCQVVDVCVLPIHQGKGVGKLIMQYIHGFITTQLPASCFVSLFADRDANKLYEKFEFQDTLPKSRGMALVV